MGIPHQTDSALVDPVVFDMALNFITWRANQARTEDLIVAARRVLVGGESINHVAEVMKFSSRQYLHQMINNRFKPVLAQARSALDAGFQPVRPAAAGRSASPSPQVAPTRTVRRPAKQVSVTAPAKTRAVTGVKAPAKRAATQLAAAPAKRSPSKAKKKPT